jgi:hypothetical protein
MDYAAQSKFSIHFPPNQNRSSFLQHPMDDIPCQFSDNVVGSTVMVETNTITHTHGHTPCLMEEAAEMENQRELLMNLCSSGNHCTET